MDIHLYEIINKKDSSKIYIGTTNNMKTRFNQHKRDSNSVLLKKDILELGVDSFEMKELFFGNKKLVYYHEKKLILELKPYYNNPLDTGGILGVANKGESHYASELCDNDIIDICKRGVAGETASSIQKDYQMVLSEHINRIIIGKSWKHVDVERRPAGTKKHHLYYELTAQDAENICFKIIEDEESRESILKQYPTLTKDTLNDILYERLFPDIEAPRLKAKKKSSFEEIEHIRNLRFSGMDAVQIKKKHYPDKSAQTIRNIINGKGHSGSPGPIKGVDY